MVAGLVPASCQLGGEAGRLAGVVHVPRLRGCYEAWPRARTHALFLKVFSCFSRARARIARKPSTGAAFSRIASYPKPDIFRVKPDIFRVKPDIFRVSSTTLSTTLT